MPVKNNNGKYLKLINSIILLFYIGSLISCKKESKDYREIYSGGYQFIVYHFAFDHNNGVTANDTILYSGSIKLSPAENKIVIDFYPNISLEPIIDEVGQFSGVDRLSGGFENNYKIIFNWKTGGLGSGASYDVTGFKKR